MFIAGWESSEAWPLRQLSFSDGSMFLLGILLVQGDALDRGYLRDRAERLGLTDLLTRAEAAARRVCVCGLEVFVKHYAVCED